MRVELNISAQVSEPYAVIYASEVSEEVNRVIAACEAKGKLIANDENQRMIVASSDEVFMVRVENGMTNIYLKDKKLYSKKRLYEVKEILGMDFMQISKGAIVNLKELDYVEPYFSGMMNLVLKNGVSEFISRKYLPDFKRYLGI